jgi:hypothetical protein
VITLRLPTGSHIVRARHCPGSFALPTVREPPTDATARGIAGHRYLEAVGRGTSHSDVLATISSEYHEDCEAIDRDGLPLGADYRQEVTFALDLETGSARELGDGLARDYSSARPSEIIGTIDVTARGRPAVYDYKFDGFDSTSDHIEINDQVRFAALCAARVMGADSAEGTLIHIRSDGSHWPETKTFDALDLDIFEGELKAIVTRVRAAQETASRGVVPDVTRGEWCRWCPAAQACPAITGLIRAVADAPTATADDLLSAITPATAGRAYKRLREVEDVVKRVRNALYLYASERDIDLGDGRVYGAVRSDRMTIDARVARKVLAERFSPEVAEAACDFETSQAAIERALKPVVAEAKRTGAKVTIRAVKDAALEAIAAAGGIETKSVVTVKEHSAGSPQQASLPQAAEPRDALTLISEVT